MEVHMSGGGGGVGTRPQYLIPGGGGGIRLDKGGGGMQRRHEGQQRPTATDNESKRSKNHLSSIMRQATRVSDCAVVKGDAGHRRPGAVQSLLHGPLWYIADMDPQGCVGNWYSVRSLVCSLRPRHTVSPPPPSPPPPQPANSRGGATHGTVTHGAWYRSVQPPRPGSCTSSLDGPSWPSRIRDSFFPFFFHSTGFCVADCSCESPERRWGSADAGQAVNNSAYWSTVLWRGRVHWGGWTFIWGRRTSIKPLGWTLPSPKKGSIDRTPQNQLRNILRFDGGAGWGGGGGGR